MDTYDPSTAPAPEHWLALDEQARIAAALKAHPGPFPDALHGASGGEMMHGALHAIVETQIASGQPGITTATVDRLMDQGLKRHPAVHKVMQVLAEQLVERSRGAPADPAWWVERLSALKAGDAVAEGLRGRLFGEDPDTVGPAGNRAQRRAAKRDKRKRK